MNRRRFILYGLAFASSCFVAAPSSIERKPEQGIVLVGDSDSGHPRSYGQALELGDIIESTLDDHLTRSEELKLQLGGTPVVYNESRGAMALTQSGFSDSRYGLEHAMQILPRYTDSASIFIDRLGLIDARAGVDPKEFASDHAQLIQYAQELGYLAVTVGLNMICDDPSFRPVIEVLNGIKQRNAEASGAIFVPSPLDACERPDLFLPEMRLPGVDVQLYEGGVHLNNEGHQMLATTIVETLSFHPSF